MPTMALAPISNALCIISDMESLRFLFEASEKFRRCYIQHFHFALFIEVNDKAGIGIGK